VIAVDVDDQTISIDDDTYAARFDYSEGYWDTVEDQWFEDVDRTLYDKALDLLNSKAKLERD
jgi:hypothetical protein